MRTGAEQGGLNLWRVKKRGPGGYGDITTRDTDPDRYGSGSIRIRIRMINMNLPSGSKIFRRRKTENRTGSRSVGSFSFCLLDPDTDPFQNENKLQ